MPNETSHMERIGIKDIYENILKGYRNQIVHFIAPYILLLVLVLSWYSYVVKNYAVEHVTDDMFSAFLFLMGFGCIFHVYTIMYVKMILYYFEGKGIHPIKALLTIFSWRGILLLPLFFVWMFVVGFSFFFVVVVGFISGRTKSDASGGLLKWLFAFNLFLFTLYVNLVPPFLHKGYSISENFKRTFNMIRYSKSGTYFTHIAVILLTCSAVLYFNEWLNGYVLWALLLLIIHYIVTFHAFFYCLASFQLSETVL